MGWGGALSGAISGGAQGFMAGGPWGALAGAGAGGVLGSGVLGGGGGGGGGLGGLLPGSGGFSLQNDAMTRSMNLSDSLKRMGEEQYGQESPYRANMLQMIQERANQQQQAYVPTAPTMYNPFNNTYRIAPTHGPAGVPRGREGFSGSPAYQQAQAPQQVAMGGGQQLRDIGGVGAALEEDYRIRSERSPYSEAPGVSSVDTDPEDTVFDTQDYYDLTRNPDALIPRSREGDFSKTSEAMGDTDYYMTRTGVSGEGGGLAEHGPSDSLMQRRRMIPERFRDNAIFSAEDYYSRDVGQERMQEENPNWRSDPELASRYWNPLTSSYDAGGTMAGNYGPQGGRFGLSANDIYTMREGRRDYLDEQGLIADPVSFGANPYAQFDQDTGQWANLSGAAGELPDMSGYGDMSLEEKQSGASRGNLGIKEPLRELIAERTTGRTPHIGTQDTRTVEQRIDPSYYDDQGQSTSMYIKDKPKVEQ